MGKSGLATILLLLLTAVIVMLTVSEGTGGAAGLWAKVTGGAEEAPATHETLSPRAMTPSQGMNHVDRAVRDMQAMDSLANTVRW